MTARVITTEHCHVLLDPSLPAVERVTPGEVVVFETLDACWGRVRSLEDLARYRESKVLSNPITGPVHVEGAKAGGTLVVEVLGVELAPEGFQLVGPNRGIVRDEEKEWTFYLVRAEGNRITLSNGPSFDVDPVVGTVGTAPRDEATNKPGPWGGNLDVPQIRTGSKVYLPIEHDGALFSLGDVHARQGDGELVGAPEIGAKVRVRFQVAAERHGPCVMIQRGDEWSVVATGKDEADAVHEAGMAAAREVAKRHHCRLSDALVAMTMLAQVRCSRVGWWGEHGPVVCVSWDGPGVGRALVRGT